MREKTAPGYETQEAQRGSGDLRFETVVRLQWSAGIRGGQWEGFRNGIPVRLNGGSCGR
jgi:hypothetical protein